MVSLFLTLGTMCLFITLIPSLVSNIFIALVPLFMLFLSMGKYFSRDTGVTYTFPSSSPKESSDFVDASSRIIGLIYSVSFMTNPSFKKIYAHIDNMLSHNSINFLNSIIKIKKPKKSPSY